MDPVTVAWWRNWAGLLLVLEVFVLSLPILIGLFFAVRGMRALRAGLPTALSRAGERTRQVEEQSRQASRLLVTPPIRIRSMARGAARGVQVLMGRKVVS